MKVVLDIEANSLTKPTKIWLVVCKDIDSGKIYIWRNLHEDAKDFLKFAGNDVSYIGHNILDYDFVVLNNIIGLPFPNTKNVIDTLLISKLVNYSRPTGHSIESYGEEFGLPKIKFNDWTQWSQEMEDYCVRDVEINHRVYLKFLRIITDPKWHSAISLEHKFQHVVNVLHSNGFAFDTSRATNLLRNVRQDLAVLDKDILEQFPPRLKLVREVSPRLTKHGTLDRKDFRWIKDGNLSDYNGYPFCKCSWVDFNPSSHKQLIQVLSMAGWAPVDKTTTHKDVEFQLKRLPSKELRDKLQHLKTYGWKINETNLGTLPDTAPAPARTLARRILLESRRRTLTEWLGLLQPDGRIHGKFVGIGAWTHRMSHQNPNCANIPNANKEDGSVKLLGRELRWLWRAPKGRLLVGVDADSIQFRIFAHYVNDKELINAIVSGRKANKTDPHSINANVLGCTRAQAKRYIYALLLGAGNGKLGSILECSEERAKEALNRILKRYPGFDYLRREVIPSDAKRGYFIGLDGRKVSIPGDTVGERKHLCMSGYLQNGEAIVMKMACLEWERDLHVYDARLVNFVHDEWQVECPNDVSCAMAIAELMCNSLVTVGVRLGLRCPLAGSYYNDDKKDYTIGTNWYQTH